MAKSSVDVSKDGVSIKAKGDGDDTTVELNLNSQDHNFSISTENVKIDKNEMTFNIKNNICFKAGDNTLKFGQNGLEAEMGGSKLSMSATGITITSPTTITLNAVPEVIIQAPQCKISGVLVDPRNMPITPTLMPM